VTLHSRSVQRKYAFIFASLVTGAVLSSSALEMVGAYDDHRLALARTQQAETRGAAAQIEQFFRTLEAALASASPAFWGAGGGTLEQRAGEYTRLLRESPAFTEIAYVDRQGLEQLDVSRLEINRFGQHVDHSNDPVFLDSRQQTIVYGPLYFRNGSEPYITIARAEGKATSGVVLAEVNLKFLRDVVSGIRIGQSGHGYVVDKNGTLVAHPDISLVLRRTDFSDLPQVRAAIEASSSADANESSMTAFDNTGKPVLSTSQVIRPLGWSIVADEPLAEAFAPLGASLLRTVAVLVVGLFVALTASVVVARRMVRPIQSLRAGAARIGRGILDRPIEIHSGDELEQLADDVNGMTQKLRESYATLERTTAERERHEQELRIARDIQQGLLPRELPELTGWSIRTHYQPARVVGGDLYDVLPLRDGRLALIVGDVSGEGVPAALLMATTRAVLRSIVAQDVSAPGDVLARANEVLVTDMPGHLFVTCLFAVLDPRSGMLRYANAGHVPPLRRQSLGRGVDQLRARGMPLGLMPGSIYEEHEVTVNGGETVLFYSDGLLEAHDRNRRMFDTAGLEAVTSEAPADGDLLIHRILEALSEFTGPDWEQEDDLTLVTLEHLQQKEPACPRHNNSWLSDQPDRTPALSISAAT
jgi:serine phosphatase RsbU (regulator of sigma subunit)